MTEQLAVQILGTAAVALVWIITALAAAFVGRYAMRTWWRSIEGRNLMSFTLMFAVTWGLTGLAPVLDVPLWQLLALQVALQVVWVWVLIRRHQMLTNADREAKADADAARNAEMTEPKE